MNATDIVYDGSLYELVEDVPNPKGDRRAKYNWRHVSVWKKGTRFLARSEKIDSAPGSVARTIELVQGDAAGRALPANWLPVEFFRALRKVERYHVFVYGSLLRGLHNHRVIESGTFVCRAVLEGARFTMLDLGSYPALIAGGPSPTEIHGEVYEVDFETLMNLDLLEGTAHGFYRRDRVTLGPNGTGMRVHVYVLVDATRYDRLTTVRAGDWRAYHHAQRDERFPYAARLLAGSRR